MKGTESEGAEIARRGQAIYNERIRQAVEPDHIGKFLVLNVDTGDYEMDADHLTASRKARSRWPDSPRFGTRVGYSAAYSFGGRFMPSKP